MKKPMYSFFEIVEAFTSGSSESDKIACIKYLVECLERTASVKEIKKFVDREYNNEFEKII